MKLITTKDYLLLVDEEAEKKNNNYAIGYDKKVILCTENNRLSIQEHWKLVIAYRPLITEAKELDLPLLPEWKIKFLLDEELTKLNIPARYDSVNKRYNYTESDIYNLFDKAAQAKQYTIDDIREAFKAGQDYMAGGNCIPNNNGSVDEETYIQSLSTQQYPKEFIPVKEYKTQSGEWKEVLLLSEWEINTQSKFKTIINSKGKTELVGTYQH